MVVVWTMGFELLLVMWLSVYFVSNKIIKLYRKLYCIIYCTLLYVFVLLGYTSWIDWFLTGMSSSLFKIFSFSVSSSWCAFTFEYLRIREDWLSDYRFCCSFVIVIFITNICINKIVFYFSLILKINSPESWDVTFEIMHYLKERRVACGA